MGPPTFSPQTHNFIGFHRIFTPITKCLKVLTVSAPLVSNHLDLQTPELFPMNSWTTCSKLEPSTSICLSKSPILDSWALQGMD